MDVARQQRAAFAAAAKLRGATVAIGSRPAARAIVSGQDDIAADGGVGRGRVRYRRTVNLTALLDELGSVPEPGEEATIYTDKETLRAKVSAGGLSRRGEMVSFTLTT